MVKRESKKKNILFVCKHNIFRSKIAEAYFKKINKNKNIKAESAGFIKGDVFDPLTKIQRDVLKKKGIIIDKKTKCLSIKLIMKQDLIIIISNDLPNIFTEGYVKKGLEVRTWKIKDVVPKNYSKNNLDNTIEQVKRKVEELVEELK